MSLLRTAIAAVALASLAGAANAQSAPDGAKVFKKCMACHTLDGVNRVGPTLQGIMDRPAATVEGFKYSKAMSAFGEAGNVWDAETMSAYLMNPRTYIKGNKMAFPGIKKQAEIDALIEYISNN